MLWVGAAQNVVKVENDILASVPDNDKERALLLLQSSGSLDQLSVNRAERSQWRWEMPYSYLDAVANEVGNAFITSP